MEVRLGRDAELAQNACDAYIIPVVGGRFAACEAQTGLTADWLAALWSMRGEPPLCVAGTLGGRALLLTRLEASCEPEQCYLALARALAECMRMCTPRVLVCCSHLDNLPEEAWLRMLEAAWLATWRDDRYKSHASGRVQLVAFDAGGKDLDALLEKAGHGARGTLLARELMNEPPCNLTPQALAAKVEALGRENDMAVTVLDAEAIEQAGMGLLHAVGKGARNGPVLILMEYNGAPEQPGRLGLVGKGVTFDTGGYSMKSERSMENMHGDMGGAAAVLGAMVAIARSRLKINITMIIPSCENRVSGSSYLPGDIIRSMAGKMVEINNTDSEGRLIMADAMTYAIREAGVDRLIDIATLTDAVQTALGDRTAGVFVTDARLRCAVEEASRVSGERLWELPFDDALCTEVLHSAFADFKNSAYGSDAGGGAIVAAHFLRTFCDGLPWMHIDIGGTGWRRTPLDDCPVGGAGFGVRLLLRTVEQLAEEGQRQ